MATRSFSNNIINVSEYLCTVGCNNDFNPTFFTTPEGEISFCYWRTEATTKPYNTRDFIKIQSSLFEKGWIHTNIFYQSSAMITSKTEKLAADFIENMIKQSKMISFNSDRDQVKVCKNDPIDNAFLYIMHASTINNAISIVNQISKMEIPSLKDPVISEDGFSVCFKDAIGNYPIVFLLTESKLAIFPKIRKCINSVNSFMHEDGSYALTFDQKNKLYDVIFNDFKDRMSKQSTDISIPTHLEYNKWSDLFLRISDKIFGISIDFIKESIVDKYFEMKELIENYPDCTAETFCKYSNPVDIESGTVGYNPFYDTKIRYRFEYGTYVRSCVICSDQKYAKYDYCHVILENIFNEIKKHESQSKSFISLLEDISNGIPIGRFEDSYFSKRIILAVSRITEKINFTIGRLIKDRRSDIICLNLNDINNLEYFADEIVKEIMALDAKYSNPTTDYFLKQMTLCYLKESKFGIINEKYVSIKYLFIEGLLINFGSSYVWNFSYDIEHIGTNYCFNGRSNINKFMICENDGKIKYIKSTSNSHMNLFDIDEIRNFTKCNIEVIDCESYINGHKTTECLNIYDIHTPGMVDSDNNNIKIKTKEQYLDLMYTSELSDYNFLFKIIDILRKINRDYDFVDKKSEFCKSIIENCSFELFPMIEICRSIIRAKTSSNKKYHLTIDDEVDYSSLSKQFSFGCISSARDSGRDPSEMSYSVVTNPAIIDVNSKSYSLGRICYNLNFGFLVDAYSLRVKRYLSLDTGLIEIQSDNNDIYFINMSCAPIRPSKDNSAMSSLNKNGKFDGKAGHPHFASYTFLCNAGAGSNSFGRWLIERYRNSEKCIFFKKGDKRGLIIRRSDFYEYLDTMFTEMHMLTKSCYNRKTRSHSGLNIEEWSHCRIL